MGWQDAVVFLVVGAAVFFLVRRIWPRREPAETFVPLDRLKRRSDDESSCH